MQDIPLEGFDEEEIQVRAVVCEERLPSRGSCFVRLKYCLCADLIKCLQLYSSTRAGQGFCLTLVFPDGLTIQGLCVYTHRRGFVSQSVWF